MIREIEICLLESRDGKITQEIMQNMSEKSYQRSLLRIGKWLYGEDDRLRKAMKQLVSIF